MNEKRKKLQFELPEKKPIGDSNHPLNPPKNPQGDVQDPNFNPEKRRDPKKDKNKRRDPKDSEKR